MSCYRSQMLSLTRKINRLRIIRRRLLDRNRRVSSAASAPSSKDLTPIWKSRSRRFNRFRKLRVWLRGKKSAWATSTASKVKNWTMRRRLREWDLKWRRFCPRWKGSFLWAMVCIMTFLPSDWQLQQLTLTRPTFVSCQLAAAHHSH